MLWRSRIPNRFAILQVVLRSISLALETAVLGSLVFIAVEFGEFYIPTFIPVRSHVLKRGERGAPRSRVEPPLMLLLSYLAGALYLRRRLRDS